MTLLSQFVGGEGTRIQEITETGDFVVPAGVHVISVYGCAPGGGAGSGGVLDYANTSRYAAGGGGGGAGESVEGRLIKVTPGETIPITFGSPGVGGPAIEVLNSTFYQGIAGTDGGDITIGSYLRLKGGKGGALGMYRSTSGPYVTGGDGGGVLGGVSSESTATATAAKETMGTTMGVFVGGSAGGKATPGAASFPGGAAPGTLNDNSIAGGYISNASGYAGGGGGGGNGLFGPGGDGGDGNLSGSGADGADGDTGAGGGGGGSTRDTVGYFSGAGGNGGPGRLWIVY